MQHEKNAAPLVFAMKDFYQYANSTSFAKT